MEAAGKFEVRRGPLPAYETADDALLGRFSLDKTFSGDLTAISKGEMLTAGSVEKGSAGYVAVERVRGTLHGRRGTFALMHTGRMTRGVPELTISVVPDSGTDELVGLTGTMTIEVTDGKHGYRMAFLIPS